MNEVSNSPRHSNHVGPVLIVPHQILLLVVEMTALVAEVESLILVAEAGIPAVVGGALGGSWGPGENSYRSMQGAREPVL